MDVSTCAKNAQVEGISVVAKNATTEIKATTVAVGQGAFKLLQKMKKLPAIIIILARYGSNVQKTHFAS